MEEHEWLHCSLCFIWSGKSIYPALRNYKSGSVNHSNLSDGRDATAFYVSDVA